MPGVQVHASKLNQSGEYMPTYVYETIPIDSTEEPVRFEIKQRMLDDPLKKHPDTGQPVRRVIAGGISFPSKNASSPGASSCCSSGSCCS